MEGCRRLRARLERRAAQEGHQQRLPHAEGGACRIPYHALGIAWYQLPHMGPTLHHLPHMGGATFLLRQAHIICKMMRSPVASVQQDGYAALLHLVRGLPEMDAQEGRRRRSLVIRKVVGDIGLRGGPLTSGAVSRLKKKDLVSELRKRGKPVSGSTAQLQSRLLKEVEAEEKKAAKKSKKAEEKAARKAAKKEEKRAAKVKAKAEEKGQASSS